MYANTAANISPLCSLNVGQMCLMAAKPTVMHLQSETSLPLRPIDRRRAAVISVSHAGRHITATVAATKQTAARVLSNARRFTIRSSRDEEQEDGGRKKKMLKRYSHLKILFLASDWIHRAGGHRGGRVCVGVEGGGGVGGAY